MRVEELLTGAEHDVATLVARGHRNSVVAAQLGISPKTVEFHLSNIYRKLAVGSRTQLAVRWLEERR